VSNEATNIPEACAVPEPSKNNKSLLHFIKETSILLVVAYILAAAFQAFLFEPTVVDMTSMFPTIKPSDKVLVNRFIYRFKNPRRGDILTFSSNEYRDYFKYGFWPTHERKILIKRLLGLPGDKIEIREGKLSVNDKVIKEKYVKLPDTDNYGPIKVPDNKFFVMGDNRAVSKDSRDIGPVDKKDIRGKAFVIYWPLNRVRSLF